MDSKPSMEISEYNRDQLETIQMVRCHLRKLSKVQLKRLRRRVNSYLRFRADVADFQNQYFSEVCTQKCFTSQTSACCGREGIATFFADMVINVLFSSVKEVDLLVETLSQDRGGFKCVYLTEQGCLWQVKPIVCEMFLCEHAKETVFGKDEALRNRWNRLLEREKRYTWPSRPVLFNELEEVFIQADFDSPLMYFHRSPGLIRVKAKHIKNPTKETE
jgi:hypothetical protein